MNDDKPTWLKFHVDPMASTESKRVQQAFEQMSLTVSNKEWVCTSGMGGTCFQPGKSVNLERNGSVVVGSVGLFAADKVSVTAKGKIAELRVRYGYFIILGSMSAGMTTKFTITLLDKTGASSGTVTNLQASGWGTPK